MAAHNETGRLGEDLAAKFLEEKGFTIFDRNYNFERNEVDIVAYIPEELHFVEVKTHTKSGNYKPEEAVNADKKRGMVKVANFYLYERQMVTVPAVFDIIAVTLNDPENPGNPEIIHFEDAFRP